MLAALASSAAMALETDQYYAWGRPLEDSAAILNAKINLELSLVLDEVNARRVPTPVSCEDIAETFRRRLHFTTFQGIELWAFKSGLVSRVPANPDEELEYRRVNLYHNHGPLDIGTWLPNSPTIEVDGIRFGTDKLAHFTSSGWRWYQNYVAGRKRGLTPAEAERHAIGDGVFWERTMLGGTASGVMSLSDLEANYQGMQFFRALCEGEAPAITFEAGKWQLARPFDIRRHVSPEWDESYQTPIYSKRRWHRVKPVLETYCDRLALPTVKQQRSDYAERDQVTPVEEFVGQLILRGRLDNPADFSIEVTCGELPPPDPVSDNPAPLHRLTPADTATGADLMAELARRDADRKARPVGLVGFHLGHPELVSGTVGGMWVQLPREYDCTTVCSFQGPALQLAAGLGGGRVSLGWARVIGDRLGVRPFVTDPHVGLGLKGTLLYTWGESRHEPPGAAFLGGEFEFTIIQVSFRIGVLYHVGGTDRGDPWLLTGGIGWGF